MASMSSNFQLSSTKTALAIIVPAQSSSDVNALRSVYDKSFGSWPPHLNIIYPFVDPERLPSALDILQKSLPTSLRPITVNIQESDVFRHRHNATVFMKPEHDTQVRLSYLRSVLVRSLGREESDGTFEGEFRPHLSIGQASLQGDAVDLLLAQARRIHVTPWECTTLAVLQRDDSGQMDRVAELYFGTGRHEKFGVADHFSFPGQFAKHKTITKSIPWIPCFGYDPVDNWVSHPHIHRSYVETPASFQISTWNLMSESFAPPIKIRLPLIIEEIKKITVSSNAYLKVLCLQEVNESMLEPLLNDRFILNTFRYCSHRPSSVLPSERNLLTLASAPFSHHTIYFDERHKSALAVIFDDLGLVITNVHLTSGLNSEAVAIRIGQMQMLRDFYSQIGEENQEIDMVLAGDFNIATSKHSIEAALSNETITVDNVHDLQSIASSYGWEDLFDISTERVGFEDGTDGLADGEYGATFDPLNNKLAAMSSRLTDSRPQRYDRILTTSGMRVKLERFERFGFDPINGNYASDHYGLLATIKYRGPDGKSPPVEDSPEESSVVIPLDTTLDNTNVDQLMLPFLPNENDKQQREEAIETLRRMLNSDSRLSNLILVPLGSYAMGTFFPDSDIDTLAIGSLSSKTFFEVATARLKLISGDDGSNSEGNGLRAVHLVNSLVPIIESSINGMKFDIQYCSAPELLQAYQAPNNQTAIEKLVFDKSLISTLSPASLRPLNTYRDTLSLLHATAPLPSYRTAHRFLAQYLQRRGLYSAKFGYLGGIHLSLLLAHVAGATAASRKHGAPPSAASLVRTFFAYFAAFDWANRVVADPAIEWHRAYARAPREPVVVLALHAPTARPNVAASCTRLSTGVIAAEFGAARDRLERGGLDGWRWCLRPREEVAGEFLRAWGAFVRIKVDVWNVARAEREKAREVVGGIESKITLLMVSLGKIVGFGLRAQVWPGRFKLSDSTEDTGISGFYLVGVSAKDEALSLEQKKSLQGKVLSAARNFESEVRASTLLKDVQNVWLEVDVVSKKKIAELGLVLDQ